MSLEVSGLGSRLLSTSPPLLPWPDAAQAYLVLGWATVLAAGLGWMVAWGMARRLTSRSASSAPPSDPPAAAARAGAPPS